MWQPAAAAAAARSGRADAVVLLAEHAGRARFRMGRLLRLLLLLLLWW